MAYIMLMAIAIFALDSAGVPVGLGFSAALFGLNFVLVLIGLFMLDRGRLVRGATAQTRAMRGGSAATASEGD
jgi:hypothetical protein